MGPLLFSSLFSEVQGHVSISPSLDRENRGKETFKTAVDHKNIHGLLALRNMKLDFLIVHFAAWPFTTSYLLQELSPLNCRERFICRLQSDFGGYLAWI